MSINLFVLLAKRKYNASHNNTSMTLLEGYHPRNPFVFFNDKTIDRKVSQILAAKNKKDQPNSLNCKLCDTAKLEKRTNCSFHRNTSTTNLLKENPSPPHVHLKRFSGLPNENWPEFEGLLRASIAVSRIPEANHQHARYLHLHLAGNALNYYLRLAENTRNDLDDSLEQLLHRYAGADQRRNFELDLQSTKFDPVKGQPDDFLTDLQRLANLAIVDDPAAHINRTDERTRRIREQFIQGMPFKNKKVLLKENDNITVNELCAIIKRRVRIDQINPEPQYTTAFNTLNASGNPAVAQAIESIMAAGRASMQVAQPPHQRVESTQYPSYRRGNY